MLAGMATRVTAVTQLTMGQKPILAAKLVSGLGGDSPWDTGSSWKHLWVSQLR